MRKGLAIRMAIKIGLLALAYFGAMALVDSGWL